ncbi:Hpt domain-containing protein [Vibrio algarum]|uniref:Hpt domain-containing protein n=1 Tax=Vibrio algarum TaxID=3020714 RepID=A0ABT4YPH3_9VIBR|nr:Hpt domain-containing protein [Vibrio sp. KJ40-1]MDB1123457.1 Hpt domain-containing protein [Vibrio sp. KJ40-1]
MTIYLNTAKIDDLCNEIGQENLPILLDIFLGELNDYQVTLMENNEDLERLLSDISHALKSSAASFGADDLCKKAQCIDASAKAGENISTVENRESMLLSIRATIEAYDLLIK